MSKNAGIRFVPQTGCKHEHDDSTTRKAIRRHVMLGKNCGRTPQNPRQPAMQGTAVFRADDWQPQPPAILAKERPRSTEGQATIPPQIGTSLSLLTFADTVSPSLMHDTLHFCTSTNKNMFVLHPCISYETPDPMTTCLPRLAHDALYLNIMVFGTQHYLHRQELQGSCLMYYGRALTILRERLVQVEAICDVTCEVSCGGVGADDEVEGQGSKGVGDEGDGGFGAV
ncbi:hypothetical protein PRZ48_014988 [Zasmidium cellare]|uniref:Uncharacterized protein n=1 Tax=Zasmidium cellare TaxID=395010 RepID=A0ABR0DXB4_ZASCE|nr:hypothetical protein PRZ48_014988 [Zasmidium cellare]